MKSIQVKKILSIFLIFAMLMPYLSVFAEEPTTTSEEYEEEYRIVDGSEINLSSGTKYYVRFVKPTTTKVYTSPPSVPYEIIPGGTEEVEETYISKAGYTETIRVEKTRNVTRSRQESSIETYYVDEPYVREVHHKDFVGFGTKEIDVEKAYTVYITQPVLVSPERQERKYYTVPGYWDKKHTIGPDGVPTVEWVWIPPQTKYRMITVPAVYRDEEVAHTRYKTVKETVTDYSKKIYNEWTEYISDTRRVKKTRTVYNTVYYTVTETYYDNEYIEHPPEFSTRIVTKTIPQRYKVTVTGAWEQSSDVPKEAVVTTIWDQVGNRYVGYIVDGRTYDLNGDRMKQGWFSRVGPTYYELTSSGGVERPDFVPWIHEATNGECKTVAERNARISQIEAEIAGASIDRLRSLLATAHRLGFDDLASRISSRIAELEEESRINQIDAEIAVASINRLKELLQEARSLNAQGLIDRIQSKIDELEKYGDTERIQIILEKLNYLRSPYVAGEFDVATSNALKSFLENQGMTQVVSYFETNSGISIAAAETNLPRSTQSMTTTSHNEINVTSNTGMISNFQKYLVQMNYLSSNGYEDGILDDATMNAFLMLLENNKEDRIFLVGYLEDVLAAVEGTGKTEIITPQQVMDFGFYLFRETPMSQLTDEQINTRMDELNETLDKYGITSPEGIALFMGNVSQETLNGWWLVENGEVEYGGTDLYNGAGYLQLTGEANYKSFAQYVYGKDEVSNTKIMTDGKYEISKNYDWESAGWFWRYGGPKKYNLSEYADQKRWDVIIGQINHNEFKYAPTNVDYMDHIINRNTRSNDMYRVLTGEELGLPEDEQGVINQHTIYGAEFGYW